MGDNTLTFMILMFVLFDPTCAGLKNVPFIAQQSSWYKELLYALAYFQHGNHAVRYVQSKHGRRRKSTYVFDLLMDKIKEVITTIVMASDNIASASVQMSSSSQQMSEGATEQAASAEEVSSSMEEMAANIQQNTDNAQQTEKISLKAAEDVNEGSNAVNETMVSMKNMRQKNRCGLAEESF